MSVALIADAVGARQHGAIHLRQLHAHGATPGEVRRAADRREILRMAPEVYVVAGAPRSWRLSLMVAVLDAGRGACASHRAAALLLGIARRDAAEIVEITAPRRNTHVARGAIVHRPLDLVHERDVIVVDGIPCTGPLRTLVDLGVSEPWFEVLDAIERAIQAELVTHKGCEWALAQHSKQGRHGCGPFRRALDERALKAGAPQRGLLEPRFHGLARRFRLPAYTYQLDVYGDGSVVADVAWVAERVIVEVDGFEAHGTPSAMTDDFERQNRLVNDGWIVLRFSWFQVVKRPKYVADTILQVLGSHSGA